MRPDDTLPPTIDFMPNAEYVAGYDDGWNDREHLSPLSKTGGTVTTPQDAPLVAALGRLVCERAVMALAYVVREHGRTFLGHDAWEQVYAIFGEGQLAPVRIQERLHLAAPSLIADARESGRLREAARRVVNEAETDDNWDGEYIDFLVPADALAALRAALDPEVGPR